MGGVKEMLSIHDVKIRLWDVTTDRDKGIVEWIDITLAERLFGQQYAKEMKLLSYKRPTKFVKYYPQLFLNWIVKKQD